MKTDPRSPSPTSLGPGKPDRYQRAFPKPNRLIAPLWGWRARWPAARCLHRRARTPAAGKGPAGEGWAVERVGLVQGEGQAVLGPLDAHGSGRIPPRSAEESSFLGGCHKPQSRRGDTAKAEAGPRLGFCERDRRWSLRVSSFARCSSRGVGSVACTKSILATVHFHLETRSLSDSLPSGFPGA